MTRCLCHGLFFHLATTNQPRRATTMREDMFVWASVCEVYLVSVCVSVCVYSWRSKLPPSSLRDSSAVNLRWLEATRKLNELSKPGAAAIIMTERLDAVRWPRRHNKGTRAMPFIYIDTNISRTRLLISSSSTSFLKLWESGLISCSDLSEVRFKRIQSHAEGRWTPEGWV